jgi:F0F1-type ATP synthase assembly protein I
MKDEPSDRSKSPGSEPEQPGDEPDNFLHLVAQATTLGWNLVVPVIGGVLLGRYLDDRFDQEFTWTLSLLVMGVFVAFNNLYAMYIEHGGSEPLRGRTEKRNREETEEGETHAENK